MADQTIVAQTAVQNGQKEVAAAQYQALTSANDGVFAVPVDGKYALHVIDAAGGAIITVKAGTGALKYSQGDLVGAAQTIDLNNFYVLESARFKAMSGADVGKIRVKTSANVSAALIALP